MPPEVRCTGRVRSTPTGLRSSHAQRRQRDLAIYSGRLTSGGAGADVPSRRIVIACCAGHVRADGSSGCWAGFEVVGVDVVEQLDDSVP
jgi:hypothetical protein